MKGEAIDWEVFDRLEADAGDDPIPSEQLPESVDVRALLEGEPPEEDWELEPLIVARRHTGIVAKRGEGKSLIAFNIVVAKAAGDPLLDQPSGDPVHVVYIDQEMNSDDLYERLTDLGYTTDHPRFEVLEKHLHYYQLIDLPPLNEREGGQLLEAIVKHNDAALVVIDTLSAVVEGDETATDTYTGLWRHTERRFKRLGITYIRLDHLGKDATRGSRGSSAKEDKLDIVWQLTQNVGGSLTFTRTKGRQPWIPETVTVSRTTTNGILTHETPVAFAEQWLVDLVYQIDELGLPEDAGIPTVQKNLRDSGNGRRRADIAKAVRFRKRRQQGVPRNPEHLGTPPRNTFGNTPEHPHRNPPLPGVSNRNSFGNTSEHPKGGVSPLEGEHPQGADDDFDAETDRIAGL